MFRHWNAWHDYKYSHLHIAPLDDSGLAGEPIDLMNDMKVDCPVPPFGGSEQYNWSPDGKQIAYTAKIVERWAESTDSDVYLVNIDSPDSAKNITEGMEGYDNDPVYSPDGRLLAFHSMQRPGFEAGSKSHPDLRPATESIKDATAGLDQNAHGRSWLPDSSGLMFCLRDRGCDQLFRVAATEGTAKQLTTDRYNWGLIDILPTDVRHSFPGPT